MSIINEFKHLSRYLFKTPADEKEILFFSEYPASYSVFEGLISELKKRYAKPFCYIASHPDDPILTADDPLINAFYFNKILPFVMTSIGAKVALMTMPSLNVYHLKRSVNDVHYVYVFHAAHSCNATYEFGAFEHYDSILCVGPHQVAELRKQEELYEFKSKALIEAGYYPIERIHEANAELRESQPSGKNRAVMFAPTWERNFALEKYGDPIVESLTDANYDVIVRLHPETTRRFSEFVGEFKARHGNKPGFTLDESASPNESMLKADVVITDWSGITPEYAFGTERPLLFLEDVPQKINNERYEELGLESAEAIFRNTLGKILPAAEIENIGEYVDRLIAERESYRSRTIELRSKYLYNFGRSSEVGVDHILSVIEDGKSSS